MRKKYDVKECPFCGKKSVKIGHRIINQKKDFMECVTHVIAEDLL